jgi:hypothetical protein
VSSLTKVLGHDLIHVQPKNGDPKAVQEHHEKPVADCEVVVLSKDVINFGANLRGLKFG